MIVFYLYKNFRTSGKIITHEAILLLIDALSFNAVFNLNFYKIFALESITSKAFWKNHVTKILAFLFLYSAFIAIASHLFFPTLSPPDEKGFLNLVVIRILRNQATLLLELGFAYTIFKAFSKPQGTEKFLNSIILVGYLMVIGMLIELVFRIDLYSFLSGGRELVFGQKDYFRLRGLAYEPRGAAQVLSLAIFSLAIQREKIFFYGSSLIFLIFLFLTYSISGAIIAMSLMILLLLSSIFFRDKKLLKKTIFLIFASTLLFFLFQRTSQLNTQLNNKSFILRNEHATNGHTTLIDKLIAKFEVLDSSYLNFLKNNPYFLLSGAGSGMGGILSQNFILPRDRGIFPNGASGVPLMGIWYYHSQFGLVGYIILLYFLTKTIPLLRKKPMDSKNIILFGGCLLFWLLSHRYITILLYSFFYLANDTSEKKLLKSKNILNKTIENNPE